MSRPAPVKPVTIIIDGVTHEGSYFLQDLTVHIRSPPERRLPKSAACHQKPSPSCCCLS